MPQPKKLIEVAMPIKEISAESVRDKSIRNGHISTLHLWWARRPLPTCRAVVFASLVPDPDDPNCPQVFRDAVELLLGKKNNPGDPYSTYTDIPWTSIFDPMEDTLRNRLQMFIGKFTDPMQKHLLGKATRPLSGNLLSDYCLIRWESKNDESILNKARKLIWVAYNSNYVSNKNELSAKELLADFDLHFRKIKKAESEFYNLVDRHLETNISKKLQDNLKIAIETFLNKMPKVFDPFAGGGAIPLEAARLGCRSYGNDINPVAHIIQKGSLEFPQKYGKPIMYSKKEFIILYGNEEWKKIDNNKFVIDDGEAIAVNIENRLAFDVEYNVKKILKETEKEIGHLYSFDENNNVPFAYLWAKVAICNNPTCNAEIPLIKQFYISSPRSANVGSNKKVYLKPIINGNLINFVIERGESKIGSWINRGNVNCPCCGSITDIKNLKEQFNSLAIKERMIAIVYDSPNGRLYKIPTQDEISKFNSLSEINNLPKGNMHPCSAGGDTFSWGITKWEQLYNKRQAIVLHQFEKKIIDLISELDVSDLVYKQAVATYLSIWFDKIMLRSTAYGKWHYLQETVEHLYGRQTVSMSFDYPELNPFSKSSNGALGQLDTILKFIYEESINHFYSIAKNSESGDMGQFDKKSIDAVITDPPYYDAIAYADISDFFYLWLKRLLLSFYPNNFVLPQTPKAEECTALKHHHHGSKIDAKNHFEGKLKQIFSAIEYQTKDIVSIMFAHQSTEAWTTLCNSILGARMNITGSWAVDTETTGALKTDKAYLSSSVTVACVPSQAEGYGDYKTVKKAVEEKVALQVEELYRLGFRGADLLTACFGQAVSEFGKYKKVEKADGSEVKVAELLVLARESAFNALLKGFDGDEYTKFYIGWLQLNGFAESDFDDAATFAKAGLSINVSDLFTSHLLIKNGNKQTLATYQERNEKSPHLGEKADSYLIDQVHKGMALYKGTDRKALLNFINEKASSPASNFWRVVTAIDELLPKDSEDQILTKGLITNKDSLIRESKETKKETVEQSKLEL